MIKKNKIWLMLAASLLVSCLAVYCLPLEFPVYATAVSGTIKPEGPITAAAPFEYCLNAPVDNPSELRIFLATYGRTNTSTYNFDLFSMQNGLKVNFDHEHFSAASIDNNQFHSFQIPSRDYPQPFCFSLTSADATDQNALTLVLTGQSEPVFEAWRHGSLWDLLQKTWLQKEWNTGKALGYGVFIIYFTSLVFFCAYLLFSMNEKNHE